VTVTILVRLFFLLLVPVVAAASQQNLAVLSGRVLDGDDAALPRAAVVLEIAASGQPAFAAVAGPDGRFVIRGVPPAAYTLRIAFPGFQPSVSDIVVSELNSSYEIGDVRLTLEGFAETVTVAGTAERAAGVDTQVYRLTGAASQSTGSVLDALKGLPGITVDQEGTITLRGSDRVAILIDGRQSSLTGFGNQRGLDNISAANIEAIEVINNPSARFDAAGMAGIVNIIYKQEQRHGLTADVGFSVGMGQFTKQRRDLPTELGSFSNNEKILPSLSLNYSTPRLRAFLQSEVLFQDDLPNNEFTTRFYDDGRVIESQVPENREQYHYTIKFGTDLKLNPANTITLSGIYDFERHVDVAQVPFILAATGQRERFWFWREQEDTGFTNVNADWKHQFGAPGHEVRANLHYTRGLEDEAYFLNEESPVRIGTDMTHIVAAENTLPLSIDYTRPLRTGRVELGTKVQRRWIPVTYTVERGLKSVIYEGLGDFSDWRENIFAGYANLVHIQQSYSLEAGLRIEQTSVAYDIPADNAYYEGSDAYDYFEVFPNAKLTYKLNAANRLIAAYNRRVDRPGEPELRIFPKYDDPELLKVGNPYLRPQFTHAYELGVARSWVAGSATMSAYRRDVTDAFSRIFAIDDSNPNYDVVNRLYENAGNFTQTGVQLLLEHAPLARLRLSGNVNWFVIDVDAFETLLLFPTRRPFALAASRDDTWDFKLNANIGLPRKSDLQLTYIYYADRSVPQGRELARSSFDVAAKWPLANERVELLFTVTDVFNDFAPQRQVDGQGFRALYQNLLETQVATIGLRVRF
jgi:hypothetical protein